MKISELARRAGVSAKAVRFYEGEGVLPPPLRAENGYRAYNELDLCRLRIVVTLRGLGIDLAESGRLATLCSEGRCEEMRGDLLRRVAERRRDIAAARAELDHLEQELAALERQLRTGEPQIPLCIGKEEGNDAALRLSMRPRLPV
jgi:MerR family transcriptional regulator, copper efflux regulator